MSQKIKTDVIVDGSVTASSFIGAATDSTKLPLTGGTITGNLGVGKSPDAVFHVYHPTTNAVARVESGDATVHINLKDNASDTYGILLSATGNDFHV